MNPAQKKHNHGEAFMVMTYQCKAGHQFNIWNSRDGVTPFGVECKAGGCQETANHVRWTSDRYEPLHRLKPGAWFFRDGTPEEAKAIMRRRLESGRGTPYELPGSEWDQVINAITTSSEFQPGWPMLAQAPIEQPSAIDAGAEPQRVTLWASSGYGAKTRKPFVAIHWKDVMEQLSPEEARAFALSVLEAAEAAIQDAFIIEWVLKTINGDEAAGIALLREFREWREKARSAQEPS